MKWFIMLIGALMLGGFIAYMENEAQKHKNDRPYVDYWLEGDHELRKMFSDKETHSSHSSGFFLFMGEALVLIQTPAQ